MRRGGEEGGSRDDRYSGGVVRSSGVRGSGVKRGEWEW